MYLFSNIRGPPRCSWGTPSRFQGVLQFQEVVVLPNAEPVSHHICPCAWDERSMGEMPMQKAVRGAAPPPRCARLCGGRGRGRGRDRLLRTVWLP